jgi:glycerophosphoryl diester phosphodiesterase
MVKLLISAVMLPVISYGINFMLGLSGRKVITNNSTLSFGLSFPGAVIISSLGIISIILILFEIGGVVLISHTSKLKSDEINLGSIFYNTIKKLPKLVGFSGVLLVLYFMIIAPFVGIGATTSLVKNLNFPPFVMDVITQNGIYLGFYILVFALGSYLIIKWMFVFHFIMIEGEISHCALKKSGKLVKKHFKSIVPKMLIAQVVIFVLATFIILFWSLFINIIYTNFDLNSYISISIVVFFSFVQSIGIMLGTMFIIPINIYVITELFYEYNYRVENKVIKSCDLSKIEFGVDVFHSLYRKKKLALLFTVIIFFASSLIWPMLMFEELNNVSTTEITGHRGSSTVAPENTITAIEEAIRQGCDYAEIDVQETKDGQIVVIHDSYLERLAGVPKNIWEVDYEEIKTYEVGSWFSEEFRGEKIPTLDEMIKYSKGKIKLNIELKPNEYSNNLEASVVCIIKENEFEDQCIVTSLNYESLIKVLEVDQTILTGYIMFAYLGDYIDMDIDIYSVEESKVTRELVEEVHKRSKKIHVWTVNDEDSMKELIELNVDNIITDNPVLLKEVITSIKNKPFEENLFEILFQEYFIKLH